MLKTLGLGMTAACLLMAAGVTVASGSAGDRDRGIEVIHAERAVVSDVGLDLDHSGGTPPDTIGDQSVFSATFRINGRTIGFDGGVCTNVADPALFQCVATNSFDKGQVTAQGLLDFRQGKGPYHLAITGGTGAYRAARGQVDITIDTPDPQHDQVTFHIIR
jgi:hypothetical protein